MTFGGVAVFSDWKPRCRSKNFGCSQSQERPNQLPVTWMYGGCCLRKQRYDGRLAQSVERWSNKPLVAGSIPATTTPFVAVLSSTDCGNSKRKL